MIFQETNGSFYEQRSTPRAYYLYDRVDKNLISYLKISGATQLQTRENGASGNQVERRINTCRLPHFACWC